MSEGEWLVSFDTDRIKEYLFSTTKLKDIRGASALLTELNEQGTWDLVQNVCPEAEKVYTGGGGALFIVPSREKAEDVVVAVERLYHERTVIASTTGACLPLAPATREHGFGARVRDLGFVLARNKAARAEMPALPVMPYLQPCDACGRYPAAHYLPDEEGAAQLLCRGCHIKRSAGIALRDQRPASEPRDFESLGELSRPAGYLAFINADGNLMGDRLARRETKADYQAFSDGLRKLLRDALDDTFRWAGQRRGMTPASELLVGGDDLLMVTAADLALEMTLRLAQTFEKKSVELLRRIREDGPPLTLSTGVIIAHTSFPVAQLHHLSQERLRQAKQCSFRAEYRTGAIDFEVVTSAVGAQPEDNALNSKEVWRYHNRRPYLLDELTGLLTHARALRAGIPSSQLQAMYDSLYVSEGHATLASLVALARLRSEGRTVLRRFFVWADCIGADKLPPWSKPRVTALGDLVEISPFVTAGGES